jgi:hypothetical protein
LEIVRIWLKANNWLKRYHSYFYNAMSRKRPPFHCETDLMKLWIFIGQQRWDQKCCRAFRFLFNF